MNHRMTRATRLTQARPAHAALLPKRLDRAVSWTDFRTAVRYDPATGAMSGCFEHGSIAWSSSGGPEITVAEASDALGDVDRDTLGRLSTAFAPHA